jgi:hypothetical protein
MARRYSPLTVVVWIGAFALLGYMGARVSQKQASLHTAGASLPAVQLADTGKTNASVGASTTVRQAAPQSPEMLSAPADTTKSEERPPRLAARAGAAGQSALRADDAPVEKSRAKRARTRHARHRDVVENGGAPMKSHDRRYAARGDLPAPAPGFRLLPFLPTFLPF